MAKFTEADAMEIGEPLPLLQKWKFVMDTLYDFFLAYSQNNKLVSFVADTNVILYRLGDGHDFKIAVQFVNHTYLCLLIEIKGKEDFAATISNIDKFSNKGIIKVVSSVITFAEDVI